LESDTTKVVCLPQFGGKLVSFFDKKQQFESLFQNPHRGFEQAPPFADFATYEACGFDDTFPSIESGIVTVGNRTYQYPDHGELWSAAFQAEKVSDSLKLHFTSKILPYSFDKTYTLNEAGLTISYYIKNNGNEAFPCFWTCHCLVNVEEGMDLIFPKDTKEVINVMKSDRLGSPLTSYNFPIDLDRNNQAFDFSKVIPPSLSSCDKYYVKHKVEQGRCGYHYVQSGMNFLFTYDANKLPYLGFWRTLGGFRGDYNCALEPSNGFYDSIAKAQENKACPILESGEVFSFQLHMQLKEDK
jgi:galactose mutarotase-like enzyme